MSEVVQTSLGEIKPNEKKPKEYKPYQLIIVAIGIIGLFLIWFCIPAASGLSPAGVRTLAILFLMVMMWISGTCHILVPSLMGVALMLLFSCAPPKVVLSGFADSAPVFLVFAFSIAAAVSKSGLGKRLAYNLMALTRPNYTVTLIIYVIISILFGALVPSGSARIVLLGTIGTMLLPAFGQSEEKMSNIGRGLFTALGLTGYMASTGFLTGGASTILTVSLLEKAGYKMTYFSWIILNLPIVLIVAILLALGIRTIFKPEITRADDKSFAEFQLKLKDLGPMSTEEKKTAVIVSLAIIFWIIGGYIGIDYLSVGAAAAVFLMLPFIKVVSSNEFNKKIPWENIYFVAGCMALSAVLTDAKVTDFLAKIAAPLMSSPNIYIFCLKIWLIATLIHFILPSSLPAFAAFMPIVIASAGSQHFSIVIPCIVFSLAYTGVVLVYQQVHAAIAYGFHQCESNDFVKPGLLLIFLWLIFTPITVAYLHLLGY
jgi:sodium-dependent dicarboxylate transporter 2/3/5